MGKNIMWEKLTENQKVKYKEWADSKYGETNVYGESGEPLYFTENMYLIPISSIISEKRNELINLLI